MNELPLVSIIMNCYNSQAYLYETLASVLKQTYQNWEIIFWDNQSTDDSAKIFNSFHDPRFKYFLSPSFTPLGQARNLAITKAHGEFIAFLDCDDLWMPEKLAESLPLFKNPEVGIVITDTYFFNQKREKILYGRNPPPQGKVFESLLNRYYISLETVVLRKAALDSLQEHFDPRFNMIEEMDLFIRLCHDWELAYCPKALAKWRIHSNSWTFQKMEQFPVERELFLSKMERLYPGFYLRYPSEVQAIRSQIAFEKANLCWRKGDGKTARQLLQPFLSISRRLKIYYFFMFLPPKVFDSINSFRSVGL